MKFFKISLSITIMAMILVGCTQQAPINVWKEKNITKPELTTYELNTIANKIYMNETSGKPENLMFWSKNEPFPSLGIGHFIWYPKGIPERFDQTFPAMIQYYIDNKVKVPAWLVAIKNTGAPWPNRSTFEKARNDPQFKELQYLLMNTKALQTKFFFERLTASIPEITDTVAPQYRDHIVKSYNAVAKSKGGWYPLIDYINFKGKGIKDTERYNNQGWGLLQVLQAMRPIAPGPNALREFSRAASATLHRRIRNSPPSKNEKRWLKGWMKRTNGYATSIL